MVLHRVFERTISGAGCDSSVWDPDHSKAGLRSHGQLKYSVPPLSSLYLLSLCPHRIQLSAFLPFTSYGSVDPVLLQPPGLLPELWSHLWYPAGLQQLLGMVPFLSPRVRFSTQKPGTSHEFSLFHNQSISTNCSTLFSNTLPGPALHACELGSHQLCVLECLFCPVCL